MTLQWTLFVYLEIACFYFEFMDHGHEPWAIDLGPWMEASAPRPTTFDYDLAMKALMVV